jgi:hypothetical protein
LRVLDLANIFVEPIDVALVGGGNSEFGDGGASRVVSEFIYDGVGHVPEKLGGSSGGDWGNGGIGRSGIVFGEYRVGTAVVPQLYSAVYGGSYFVSGWAFVFADSGAGIKASGRGLVGYYAMNDASCRNDFSWSAD